MPQPISETEIQGMVCIIKRGKTHAEFHSLWGQARPEEGAVGEEEHALLTKILRHKLSIRVRLATAWILETNGVAAWESAISFIGALATTFITY